MNVFHVPGTILSTEIQRWLDEKRELDPKELISRGDSESNMTVSDRAWGCSTVVEDWLDVFKVFGSIPVK